MFEYPTDNNIQSANDFVLYIETLILKGKLISGERLPAERVLTTKLKLSRATIREGLKSLVALGLVESKKGSGSYITNNIKSSLFLPSSVAFKLSDGTIDQIIEFRKLIEIFAVKKACTHMKKHDYNELVKIHQKMQKVESYDDKDKLNIAFHRRIIDSTNNQLIISSYEGASYMLDNFIFKFSSIENYNINIIYKEHQEIIDSIYNHDAIAAVEVMDKHLSSINAI